ncbi:MAG: phosphoserine phosphatase [Nocardioidaceae bacterium]|jgi:phosphoserine phosphatase|nr:phosphoserine phosphatase [Nocardioidaceae bacterium]
MTPTPTLLLIITGPDRPGVTAAFFATLADYAVEVLDVEQSVLRGRLVLSILVTAPTNHKALALAAKATADALGMDIEIEHGTGDNEHRREGRVHVTVLGHRLPASAVAAICGRIADTGANIDRIVRMARYPVTAIELHVSGTDVARLRTLLALEAAQQRVDVAVQAVGLLRHGPRLIVMDVDSTLVQGEAIDLLAAEAGVGAEVAALTEQAMRGTIDFADALHKRVALLAGLEESAISRAYDDLPLAPGARTLVRTLTRLGYRFALVSGGFATITDRIAAELGIARTASNRLEVSDGRLTGNLVGPVVDAHGKALALRRFAEAEGLGTERTVAIGDGANDLEMLSAAGLGIAFNAKPMVREHADAAVSVPYLDTVMYLLGISREDIEAADRLEGIETPRPTV